jgi:hypothetical protein
VFRGCGGSVIEKLLAGLPNVPGVCVIESAQEWSVVKSIHILAVGVLLIAGCQDSRVPALEQRVKQLEEQVKQLEEAHTKASDADLERRTSLAGCICDANANFQKDLEHNGTKLRNGSYNVPVPVLEQMRQQQQMKIEQCKILNAK